MKPEAATDTPHGYPTRNILNLFRLIIATKQTLDSFSYHFLV
jgi:hypothetical protein